MSHRRKNSVRDTVRGNKWISVNGGTETKCKELRDGVESNLFENVFNIPLNNGETAKLFVSTTSKVLTYQGKDVVTGEEYTVAEIPKWVYAFAVVYILSWIFILGGALGAVVDLFAMAFTVQTASRSKKSTAGKVGACVGIAVGAVVVSLVIALLVGGLLA